MTALAEMREEDIDLSDIPEVRELPPGAVRGGFHQVRAVHLTASLHAYFSAIAARKGVALDVLI